MSKVTVFDASALIALSRDEPGAANILQFLPGGIIGSVNLSEAIAKFVERDGDPEIAARGIAAFRLKVIPFDEKLAYAAGALRKETRASGLSFGDRACLALAAQIGATAVTFDRKWGELDIGIEIVVLER